MRKIEQDNRYKKPLQKAEKELVFWKKLWYTLKMTVSMGFCAHRYEGGKTQNEFTG